MPAVDGPVYMYSGQKRQTTEHFKAELRSRLAKDYHATYTYSKELQSLAMCMVDEDKIAQDELKASKKKWTTQRGFIYPVPRPASEYNRHPRQLSEARREELTQEWVDEHQIQYDVVDDPSTYLNNFLPLSIDIQIFRYIQIYSNIFKYSNTFRFIQIFSNI